MFSNWTIPFIITPGKIIFIIYYFTILKQVKDFLTKNGFQNNRNNDYINPQLGIILEDLHDENVLTKDDILYFIDTVFYLTAEFWK